VGCLGNVPKDFFGAAAWTEENDRQSAANRRIEAQFAGAKLPWLFLFAMGFFFAYK